MKIIAAVSKDWKIGNDADMLWHCPEDFKHYKEKTTGNVLIVGRKTYESLPKVALQNRTHIIITKDESDLDIPENLDLHIAYSVKEAIKEAIKEAKLLADKEGKEIYIIGGQRIYEQFLPLVDEVELTWINKSYPEANKEFPVNYLTNNYSITGDSSWLTSKKDIEYRFTSYKFKESSRIKNQNRLLLYNFAKRYQGLTDYEILPAEIETILAYNNL